MRNETTRRLLGAGALGAVLGGVVQVWAVLGEEGDLFRADSASQFYEAQARAWLDGRWDVSPDSLGPEAIEHKGRVYGYFGPLPALLRLPVVAVTDQLDARMGPVSMLLAAAVTAVAAWILYVEVRRIVRPRAEAHGVELTLVALWTASVLAGSALLFLSTRTFMYHEAIAWGVALTTASLAVLVRASRVGAVSVPLVMALLTGAVLSRLATAAGALLLAGVVGAALLAPGVPARARPAGLAVCAAMIAAVGAYGAVNFAKFDSPTHIPFEGHAGMKSAPARIERYEAYGMFGPRYVPTNLLQYVRPDGLGYSDVIPWVTFPNRPATVVGNVEFDGFEKSSSIPASMPFLTLLVVVGLFAGVRHKKAEGVLAIGAVVVAAGFGITLASAGNTHRYLGDAMPALILGSALGLQRVVTWAERYRGIVLSGASALVAVGIVVNVSLGVLTQRSTSIEFASFQRDVRTRVGGRFPVLRIPPDANVPPLRTGQFVVVGDCDVLYIDNGIWMLPVDRGPGGGEFDLTLAVRPAPPGTQEPLVGAGAPGAADYLVLEHLGDGEVRFGYVHWGEPLVTGQTFRPGAGPFTVHVVFDRTLSVVSVDLGETNLLSLRPVMFPPGGHPLVFGRNHAGADMRPSFRGMFLAPTRTPAPGCVAFTRELDG